MANLLSLLDSLNRKERFFLIGDALDNRKFSLGDDFRLKLERATKISIPSDAWVAMDYHLDWLSAAIHVIRNSLDPAVPWANSDVVEGNQEDTDLIVGFEKGDETVLILVEAKADTAWSNKQMTSKMNRYSKIFGTASKRNDGIIPVFVLTSPERPRKLDFADWPSWTLVDNDIVWMELHMAPERLRLLRCDDSGHSSRHGGYAVVR